MKTVKRLYPPSPKAVYAFNEAQKYKYALLHGAVRSSKSHTLNVLAFHELKKLPPCNVLISGKNLSAVNRNIIEVWKEQLGAHKFRWHKLNDSGYYTIAHAGLTGKKFYTTGAGRDKDDEKIQGATFGYWLADEIALHTREFVMMAISRLSLPFSKARWSCNPDTPTHYIKTDFIDNPNAENFFHLLFTLDDNPSLTEEYKRETKSFYTGVFYKRMILGQWVAAEGAIYDMFDYDRHIIDYGSYDFREYKKLFIGVDYGYRNATVYLFCALRHDGKIDVLDEWYWSGKNSQETMDDDKLARYMVEFTQRVIPNNDRTSFEVVVDPSAVSFIQMLRKYGFIVKNGVNKVLDGIHDVQTKLSKNKLRINKRCVNLIDEMQSYTWDEEMSLKKGVDTPTKVNDHCCFSGDTLVYVNNQVMRFAEIPSNGLIVGFEGKSVPYWNGGLTRHAKICTITLADGQVITATPDHKFLTDRGWVEADKLKGLSLCISTERNFQEKKMDITIEHYQNKRLNNTDKSESLYIGKYGAFIMEKFQMVFTCIILMVIRKTMNSPILNLFTHLGICRNMQNSSIKTTLNGQENRLRSIKTICVNGIAVKRVLAGIGNITQSQGIKCMKKLRKYAHAVSRFSLGTRGGLKYTVATDVNQRREEIAELIISRNFAQDAGNNSLSIDIQNKYIAVERVDMVDKEVDVYCLATADGCFSLANGVIVSNCDALRYAIRTCVPEKYQ